MSVNVFEIRLRMIYKKVIYHKYKSVEEYNVIVKIDQKYYQKYFHQKRS